MIVEPKIEKPTREMLFLALHGEVAELEAAIDAIGGETYATRVIPLCMLAAGYIVVDLCSGWPTDADLREIARHTASTTTEFELLEQDVYDYLHRGAVGFRSIPEVFPEMRQDYTLPVLITGRLLVAFRLGDSNDRSAYLDTVWNSINAAERMDLGLLPALTLRSRRLRAARAAST